MLSDCWTIYILRFGVIPKMLRKLEHKGSHFFILERQTTPEKEGTEEEKVELAFGHFSLAHPFPSTYSMYSLLEARPFIVSVCYVGIW